jgi:uncharacterized membrane protein YgcG
MERLRTDNIQALAACLLKRYKEIRRHEGRLPLAKDAELTIRFNIQSILEKMSARSPKLFETKMEVFVPHFQILINLRRTSVDETPKTKDAKRSVEGEASEFMDGPLLFNAWPALAGAYRQILVDLRLPLNHIESIPVALNSYVIEELGLDCDNRTEAKSRCAEILRVLQPDRQSTTRSYDDVETSYRHDHRLEGEVASVTAAHDNVVSGHDNMSAVVNSLAGAVVGGNAAMTDALKAFVENYSALNVPGQGTTPSTTAPITTAPITTAPITTTSSTTTRAGTSFVTVPSAGSVPSIEEQARYVHGVQQIKMGYVTGAEIKEKEDGYLKLEWRMRLYDQAMVDISHHRAGGPVPVSVTKLNVPDVQACYIRLVQLWQDLGVDERWNVQKLRTDKDLMYPFAMAMREAHYLLYLLAFYGDNYERLRETGWSLSHMRWVQSDMTPYASDLPFAHSKSDVDGMCLALQTYCPEQPLLKRQFKPVDETQAAAEAKTDSDNAQTDGDCPQYAQGVCQVINFCPLNHPEHLRKTAVCGEFNNNGICRWGLGCSYQHIRLQTQATQSGKGQAAAQQAAAGIAPAAGITYVLNGRGEQLNSQDLNNYCDNWTKGKCHNNYCPRLHQHPPRVLMKQAQAEETSTRSTSTQPTPTAPGEQPTKQTITIIPPIPLPPAPPADPASPTNQQVCRAFAQGRVCRWGDNCKFSHETTGDTTMGGAASNGDNRSRSSSSPAPTREARFNKPCKNEGNGQACTSNNCAFIHSNRNSSNYKNTRQRGDKGGNGGKGGKGGKGGNGGGGGGNGGKGGRGGVQIACRGCHQVGHMQRDCPREQKKNKKSGDGGRVGRRRSSTTTAFL